jgi:hypothetical protein
MPYSTTIAEAVTAGSGSEDASGAAGGVGNAAGGVRSADVGCTDAVQDSGPIWLAENSDAKDGKDAPDTWTETTEPALIPKVFPVYAFI